eukprot:7095291-Prymnesium_polylepis.1
MVAATCAEVSRTLLSKPTSADTAVPSPSCDSGRVPSMTGGAVAMVQTSREALSHNKAPKFPDGHETHSQHKQSQITHESDTFEVDDEGSRGGGGRGAETEGDVVGGGRNGAGPAEEAGGGGGGIK